MRSVQEVAASKALEEKQMLKCVNTNAGQLVNKREDLCMITVRCEPDIMVVTELVSKAQSLSINTAVLAVSGYSLFTSFDPSISNLGRSGICGVCIYGWDHIHAAQVRFTDSNVTEYVWLQIRLGGQIHCY